MRCIKAGGDRPNGTAPSVGVCAAPGTESPLHTHADSMRLIQMMDAFRAEWGILYPFEAKDVLRGAGFCAGFGGRENTGETVTAASGVGFSVGARNVNADVGFSGNANAGTGDATAVKAEKAKKPEPQEDIVVYTDGACSGNPGRGGWGAVIIVDGKEHQMSGGEKLTTNNRMELMAAIEALEAIIDDRHWRNRKVCVVSDSQYVKNGIQTWIKNWKKNGWRTSNKEPVKNKDLWLELDEAVSRLEIEWRWVKGHAGNKYNEMCDRLAVEAGQKQ